MKNLNEAKILLERLRRILLKIRKMKEIRILQLLPLLLEERLLRNIRCNL
jgi:hypothetical protein